MKRVQFTSRTRAGAIAFKLGVEYVNDSALTVFEPVRRGREWVVEVDDEDAYEDE